MRVGSVDAGRHGIGGDRHARDAGGQNLVGQRGAARVSLRRPGDERRVEAPVASYNIRRQSLGPGEGRGYLGSEGLSSALTRHRDRHALDRRRRTAGNGEVTAQDLLGQRQNQVHDQVGERRRTSVFRGAEVKPGRESFDEAFCLGAGDVRHGQLLRPQNHVRQLDALA